MSSKIADLQPRLLTAFQQILAEDRLSHAYLFSGNFGAYDLAIYLTQSRFCDDLSEDRLPCGVCRSCRLVASGELADVTVLEPTGQLIKTDQVRELTKDFARSSFEGGGQVFIIKDADKMHTNAANRLLKQIEEPNSNYYVFFLTSDESKVLPTIKSRCQVFRLVTDRDYLLAQFEAAGLLKSQALILAQLTDDPEEVASLAANRKLLDLLGLCSRFVELLSGDAEASYLQVPRLVSAATDKSDQDLCWRLLLVLAAQELTRSGRSALVQNTHQARLMWQANVSFQNALDHLVLKR